MSIKAASKEAKKSPFKQHKLGAVIVKRGRILSTGYNEIRWNKKLRKENIHAEESAIVKLLTEKRMHDLVGADIYVTRFTKGGRVGMARPCGCCNRLIATCGIRRVFYTTDDDTVLEYKV